MHLTFLYSTRPALESFVVMSGEVYLVSHWAAGAFQNSDLRCSDIVDFCESVTRASVWEGGLVKGGPRGCSNTTVVRWCTMVWRRRTGSIWAQAAAQPGQSFHSLQAVEEKRGLRAQSRSCLPLLRLSLLILPPFTGLPSSPERGTGDMMKIEPWSEEEQQDWWKNLGQAINYWETIMENESKFVNTLSIPHLPFYMPTNLPVCPSNCIIVYLHIQQIICRHIYLSIIILFFLLGMWINNIILLWMSLWI